MEFLKGETDPVGDCGNFGAGIDVHGADQFPHDSKKRTWYSRVECYGSTAEQAQELRDKVLGLLLTTEHDGELHKAVFMALESYGGADTFRDGLLALAKQSKERGADLERVTAERDAALAELKATKVRENLLLNSPNNVFKKMCDLAISQRDTLQQRLTAADERADLLEGLFANAYESAAKWVEKRCDDYVEEHGSRDPETGTVEFPGDGEEYVGELMEIAEGLRALKPAEGGGDER
jgi:hypothetical protein